MKKSKGSLKNTMFLFIVILLLLSFIIEILYNFLNIKPLQSYFIGLLFVVTLQFKKLIKLIKKQSKKKRNKKPTNNKHNTKSNSINIKYVPLNNAVNKTNDFFAHIIKKFSQAWKQGTIILIFIILFLPFLASLSANAHLWGKSFYLTGQFFSKMTYINKDASSNDNKNNIRKNNDKFRENNSSVDNIYKEKYTQNTFLRKPDYFISLSEDESKYLYFKDILTSHLDSAREVAQKLLPFLQYILSQQLVSQYNETSDSCILEKVYQASIKETNMANSDDLDSVIKMRNDVWNAGYKTFKIATLLANNMQSYAKEYLNVNKHFETIEYYYAYSIFWIWQSLKLETISQNEFEDHLEYVSMRYNDISYIAPNDSQEQKQANLISDALKIINEETDYISIKNGTATINNM